MADIIDRSKLSGLIPEPVTREIIQGAVTESAVLRMARRLPNMAARHKRSTYWTPCPPPTLSTARRPPEQAIPKLR